MGERRSKGEKPSRKYGLLSDTKRTRMKDKRVESGRNSQSGINRCRLMDAEKRRKKGDGENS